MHLDPELLVSGSMPDTAARSISPPLLFARCCWHFATRLWSSLSCWIARCQACAVLMVLSACTTEFTHRRRLLAATGCQCRWWCWLEGCTCIGCCGLTAWWLPSRAGPLKHPAGPCPGSSRVLHHEAVTSCPEHHQSTIISSIQQHVRPQLPSRPAVSARAKPTHLLTKLPLTTSEHTQVCLF